MNITSDDVLSEILLRLPVKSLVCFQLVSKHWRSLITKPYFSILRNPSPNPALGLFLHKYFSTVLNEHEFEYFSFSRINHFPPNPELNIPSDVGGTEIVQSCNGLFLCCSFLNFLENKTCYIYNPTTRTSLQLPALEVQFRRIKGVSLAFDPTKSPHYKVVCVFIGSNAYEYTIYSSKTRSWRKCAEPFRADSVQFEKGVYWNGAIHWSSCRSDGSLYLNVENDDEMPRKLRLPPIESGEDFRFCCYLGESCDHLHYIEFYEVQLEFNVYEMKRDYSDWFVKYYVDLFPVVEAYPVMYMDDFDPTMLYPYGFSIFSLVRGTVKEEDSFLVLHIPGEVVKYNLANGNFETIYKFEDTEDDVIQGSLRYEDTNTSSLFLLWIRILATFS